MNLVKIFKIISLSLKNSLSYRIHFYIMGGINVFWFFLWPNRLPMLGNNYKEGMTKNNK